jgi:putative transposase
MPYYRRARAAGGTFFFTLVTERRAPILCTDLARGILHDVIEECCKTRSMKIHAMVLLSDHLHLLVELPEGDGDYSVRLAFIKSQFTREYLAAGGEEQTRSVSREKKRRRGVWQRWFWEHAVRDTDDFNAHMDYIHYNPVKHGVAACPHGYAYSTFGRVVEKGLYEADWMCGCGGRKVVPPRFENLPVGMMD